MSAKYRIIECDNLYKTWYEVERKGWFGWNKENFIDAGVIFWAEYPIQFKTYEQAKQYITDRLPKVVEKELPVKRTVYETI